MKIGYARVSKFEQNLDMQKDALKLAGCERIFTDKLSGNVKDRPGLDKIKEILRDGDKLVVWRFDRLGRSVKHLVQFVTELEEMGVTFESITEQIDTTTPSGKLMLHMFFAFAEFERNLNIERSKKGLIAARARGRKGGRPFKLLKKDVVKMKKIYEEKTLSIRGLCKLFGVSIPTLYKYLKNDDYLHEIEKNDDYNYENDDISSEITEEDLLKIQKDNLIKQYYK